MYYNNIINRHSTNYAHTAAVSEISRYHLMGHVSVLLDAGARKDSLRLCFMWSN